MGRPTWWHHSRLDVRSHPFSPCSPFLSIAAPYRKYVHGYVTGRGYTPPDSSADPRESDSVVSKEPLEPSGENEKNSRAIDVAIVPK
jgi:hypothetical protein